MMNRDDRRPLPSPETLTGGDGSEVGYWGPDDLVTLPDHDLGGEG